MRGYVCGLCFNPGGTLVNKGTSKQPFYVHAQGQCKPVNLKTKYEIYSRSPEFWLFLTNIGVDYNREEIK
ncbi:hypothetical protein M0R72_11335 [Candidatus Pacearchaeota archaeon]|jgi:hypothetical protein|nr:hypothetical protein [Candidatus Pacearchaeota archaeon]